jgi:transcription antitermination factor NusG
MNKITSSPWVALQTRPRSERQVELLLTHKGYECLLPMYWQKRRWSDRIVEVELPLFPTYVFCRFSTFAIGKAISTPGVTRVVRFGGQHAEVDVNEIDALKMLVRGNLLREPWLYVPEGTVVRVESGPLAGAQGIICSSDARRRFVISVTLLQRSVAVQLDENTVVSVIEDPKKRLHDNESDLALNLIKRVSAY